MKFDNIDTIEKIRFTKAKLLSDPLFFTQFFFKYHLGKKFVVGEHHILICEKIKKIFTGEITKLIINMPPRYGKTELMVKTLIAMGLALNPASKYIHSSYSDTLALDNSEAVKDLINSEAYQYFFPMQIKPDSKSKKKWYTMDGGGVYATLSSGQITGFGAGIMDNEEANINESASDLEKMSRFGGALIIDDPIKPEDARSWVIRSRVNERFDSTFRSRLNSRKTPIIIIMQRLHADDLTGYLLKKEPGEWETLTLPALKDDGKPLWEYKQTAEELYKISKTTPYVFYYQYQQQDIDIKTGGEYLHNFDVNKHIKKLSVEPGVIMNIAIDNNLYPYISISFFQFVDITGKSWIVRQVHHIPAKEPNNTARQSGKLAADYLKRSGYNLKTVRLYGDRTTKNRTTTDDEKRSFAQLFTNSLTEAGFYVENKMLNFAPSPAAIGEFLNAILAEELPFARIEINETCIYSKKDYLETKKDKDGAILKHIVTDPHTGRSYQENGHCLDNLKDLIVQAFYNEFRLFHNKTSVFTPDSIKRF